MGIAETAAGKRSRAVQPAIPFMVSTPVPLVALGEYSHHNPHPIQEQSTGQPRYPTTRVEWADFPVEQTAYDDGIVRGERLLIGGWSVMEAWERPVQRAIIDKLFESIHGPARVLIRGEGLGYSTTAAIEEMRDRGGGELHIIELHPDILEEGTRRVDTFLTALPPNQRSSIRVVWHLGDAAGITKKFDDDYFDAIYSDTFPLSKDEKHINDVVDLDEQIRCLKQGGVYAPFIGYRYGPSARQLQYIGRYFRHHETNFVAVRPPKDCPYYKDPEMAFTICKGPRKNSGVIFSANK